eukprot:392815-Rhodomonas_salina.2
MDCASSLSRSLSLSSFPSLSPLSPSLTLGTRPDGSLYHLRSIRESKARQQYSANRLSMQRSAEYPGGACWSWHPGSRVPAYLTLAQLMGMLVLISRYGATSDHSLTHPMPTLPNPLRGILPHLMGRLPHHIGTQVRPHAFHRHPGTVMASRDTLSAYARATRCPVLTSSSSTRSAYTIATRCPLRSIRYPLGVSYCPGAYGATSGTDEPPHRMVLQLSSTDTAYYPTQPPNSTSSTRS